MEKLIFDKNLPTQRELPVSSIYMRPFNNTINANASFTAETRPDLDDFIAAGRDFSTLTIEMSDGTTRPTYGTYNYIRDFTINYFDKETGNYDITVGLKEE